MDIDNRRAQGHTPEDPMNGSNEFYIREHGIHRELGSLTTFAEMDAANAQATQALAHGSEGPVSDSKESDLRNHQ